MAQKWSLAAVLGGLFLLTAQAVRADVYVYVDENGVSHYSNTQLSPEYTLQSRTPRKSFSLSEIYVCVDEKTGAYRFAAESLTPCYKRHTNFTWKTLGKTQDFNDGFYDRLIAQVARRHKIEFALVKAVIKAESDFNSEAVSKTGAQGLMQLMPDTAKAQGVTDPFNPESNIEGGVRFLAHLYQRYRGNLDLALAAYNAGETAVAKYNGIPPYPETRRYIHKVRRYLDTYRQAK